MIALSNNSNKTCTTGCPTELHPKTVSWLYKWAPSSALFNNSSEMSTAGYPAVLQFDEYADGCLVLFSLTIRLKRQQMGTVLHATALLVKSAIRTLNHGYIQPSVSWRFSQCLEIYSNNTSLKWSFCYFFNYVPNNTVFIYNLFKLSSSFQALLVHSIVFFLFCLTQ